MGLDIRFGWILRVTSTILVTCVSPPPSYWTFWTASIPIDPSSRSLPENIETVTASSRTNNWVIPAVKQKMPNYLEQTPRSVHAQTGHSFSGKYRTKQNALSISKRDEDIFLETRATDSASLAISDSIRPSCWRIQTLRALPPNETANAVLSLWKKRVSIGNFVPSSTAAGPTANST